MRAAGEQHEHRDRRRDDRQAPLARLTADRGRCRRTTALRGAALRRRGTVVEAGSRAALRRRPAAVAVARRGSAERRRRALRRRLPGVSLLVRGLVGRLVRRLGAGWGGVRPGRRADGRERSRPGPAVRPTAAHPAGAECRGRGECADGGRLGRRVRRGRRSEQLGRCRRLRLGDRRRRPEPRCSEPAPSLGDHRAPGEATPAGGGTFALAVPCSAARVAAPRATAYLGCASTRVGRFSAAVIICATSGIREEPPTSSTALRSAGLDAAPSAACG